MADKKQTPNPEEHITPEAPAPDIFGPPPAPPDLTAEAAVMLEKEGVAALLEMGESLPDPSEFFIPPPMVDKLVRQIFERMKAAPKSDIVNICYQEKMRERKALPRTIQTDYTKTVADLDTLKAEGIKALRGESTFSKEMLSDLITEAEAKCSQFQKQFDEAHAAYDAEQAILQSLNAQYDDIIPWADMYDTASIEAKKMIVGCLSSCMEVYRNYKLHIDFNIDLEQFSVGMDIVEIAA